MYLFDNSILFILSLFAASFVTSSHHHHYHSRSSRNKCYKQCELHRPPGSKEAYVLLCDNSTFSVQQRAECRAGCRQCPSTDICDYSIKPVQIYCRAIDQIIGGCKRRCDYQRPGGYFGEYSFSCENETLFPGAWDIRQCINDCRECPPPVCDFLEEEYNCPAVNESEYQRPPPPPPEPPYDGLCESRCNKDRPLGRGNDDSYKLICRQKYEDNEKGEEACIQECASCPLKVCDAEYDPGNYKCPPTRHAPLPDPPKPGTFIVSWTVIGLIAASVLGCMLGTTFFGRVGGGPVNRPNVRQRSILDNVVSRRTLDHGEIRENEAVNDTPSTAVNSG